MEIVCPKCGKVARKTDTKYGPRNHCCDLWSWGNAPLVDKETHNARKSAHRTFDRIWKLKLMNRAQAYKWLSNRMNISAKRCHIKLMNKKQAKKVKKLSYTKLKSLQEQREAKQTDLFRLDQKIG